MKVIMLASLLGLGFCSLARGQIEYWSPLTVHGKDFDPLSKEMRVKYAKVLLPEVEAIYDSIPNLSPDQERWLKKEEDRIEKLKEDHKAEGVARVAFFGSKEYRLRYAKQSFENIRTILRGMEKAEAANKSIQAWTMAAWLMTDRDAFLNLEWLCEHGVVSLGRRAGDLQLEFIVHEIGRAILERIVFENVRKIEIQK